MTNSDGEISEDYSVYTYITLIILVTFWSWHSQKSNGANGKNCIEAKSLVRTKIGYIGPSVKFQNFLPKKIFANFLHRFCLHSASELYFIFVVCNCRYIKREIFCVIRSNQINMSRLGCIDFRLLLNKLNWLNYRIYK